MAMLNHRRIFDTTSVELVPSTHSGEIGQATEKMGKSNRKRLVMETMVVEASFMKRLHASRPHSQMGRPRTYLSGILFL